MGVRQGWRQPIWLIPIFGLYALTLVVWMAVGTGADGRSLAIGLSHVPPEVAGVAVAWLASLRSGDPATSRAWKLIGAALGFWILGDLLLALFEFVDSGEPLLSVADVAYFGFYPCLAAGLLSFPGAPRSRAERRNLALDAIIVLVGATMVVWYLVVGPAVRADEGALTIVLSVAYPVGDLVLLFGLTLLVLRQPRRDPALVVLLAAVALVLVADIGYRRLTLTDSFDRGDWPDIGWMAAECLFLLAAVVQVRRRPSDRDRVPDRFPRRAGQLPYAAAAVGYGLMLAVGWQAGHYRRNGLLIGAATLTGVVLIRQAFVMRENQRLADQERRLAAIVASSDDSIIASTLDGTILDWNPGAERMYGYPAEDVAGYHLGLICPPERIPELCTALEQVGRGKVHRYETVRVRKDGSCVHVSSTVSPIRDASGKVVGASGIDRDITEHQRLDALRDEFITNAAHELRTPMATLTVLGEILADHLREMTPEQISRSLVALERQGRRANTLIANLLDLSQLQGGRMPLTIECVNLVLTAKVALETAPPPGTTTVDICVPAEFEVRADALRLEQIFTNLLTNAYRYGGEHIEFHARRDGDAVIVSVCDDGDGVPGHLAPRLFEPFTRDLAASSHGGSGIGLALWHEAVVPHGSCFNVRLPAA
jgi:two-component system sensor histidine kinase/response regulator